MINIFKFAVYFLIILFLIYLDEIKLLFNIFFISIPFLIMDEYNSLHNYYEYPDFPNLDEY